MNESFWDAHGVEIGACTIFDILSDRTKFGRRTKKCPIRCSGDAATFPGKVRAPMYKNRWQTEKELYSTTVHIPRGQRITKTNQEITLCSRKIFFANRRVGNPRSSGGVPGTHRGIADWTILKVPEVNSGVIFGGLNLGLWRVLAGREHRRDSDGVNESFWDGQGDRD